MKTYGIFRKLDGLGRVVVPQEIRRFHGIAEGDWVEILSTDEGILIRKVVQREAVLKAE